jgi:hypothetical protein
MATDKKYNVEKGRINFDSALFEYYTNTTSDHP